MLLDWQWPSVWQWQLALVGILGVTLLMPVIRRYALSHGLSDQPGKRRLHQHVIARGGGASIVLVMLAGIVLSLPSGFSSVLLVSAYVLCALTGWLDDHQPMQPLLKFMLLAVVAVATVFSLGPERLQAAFTPALVTEWLSSSAIPIAVVVIAALLAFILLWFINLFNFMDGSHGLTASQALLACCAILVFAQPMPAFNPLCWLLAGCLLAFLPWNFPKPVIFLGDVGSLSLGLLIGWLLLAYVSSGALHPMQALLMPGLFLVDATATLLMRMLQGEAWFHPHTRHAYQCLVHHGWSHTRVGLIYFMGNLVLVYPALWLTNHWPDYTVRIVLACFVLLTLLWSVVQLVTSGVKSSLEQDSDVEA